MQALDLTKHGTFDKEHHSSKLIIDVTDSWSKRYSELLGSANDTLVVHMREVE